MTLPQGWIEAAIGDVAPVRNSKVSPEELGNAPFIGLEHIEPHTGRLIDCGKAADVKSSVATFESGDILFGRLRPYLNKVFAADFRGCASAEFVPFVPMQGIKRRYLQRVMMSPEFLRFTASLDRGDRPRVSAAEVSGFRFNLPPEAEQGRIVAKLDALTARLSRARAELDRLPVLAERLRTEALSSTFRNSAQSQTIRQVTEFVTSGSRGWAKYYADDGPAFIRVGDVRRRNIRLNLTSLQRVRPPAGAEGARTAVQTDDVVVTITADLGRVGMVTNALGPGYVNQHVALLRPKSAGDAEWIAWYLSSPSGQAQMLAQDRGVTKAGLGLDDIRNVQIPMPDTAERLKGVARLNAAFARAERMEAEAGRARALLDRLETAILARAFRGELVPQDPDDEPASVLLDRIRAQRAAAARPARSFKARS